MGREVGRERRHSRSVFTCDSGANIITPPASGATGGKRANGFVACVAFLHCAPDSLAGELSEAKKEQPRRVSFFRESAGGPSGRMPSLLRGRKKVRYFDAGMCGAVYALSRRDHQRASSTGWLAGVVLPIRRYVTVTYYIADSQDFVRACCD